VAALLARGPGRGELGAGRKVARTVQRIGLIVLVLCWASLRAHARQSQPGTGASPAAPLALRRAPPPLPLPSDPPSSLDWSYRSPRVALELAIVTPSSLLAAGAVLMLTSERRGDNMWWGGLALATLGFTVGPGAGHIYTGSYGHAAGMSALRLLAAGVGVTLLATLVKGDCEDGPPGSCDTSWAGLFFAVGVLAVIPATGLYDIIDAPRSARRANAQHGLTQLSLVPLIAPNGPFAQRGLALSGRF